MLLAKVRRGVSKIRKAMSLRRIFSAAIDKSSAKSQFRDMGPFLQYPLNAAVLLKPRQNRLKRREGCS